MKTGINLFRLLLILLFFLLPFESYYSQVSTVNISGTVSDSAAGEKLSYVSIAVYGDASKNSFPVKGTSTDINGRYQIHLQKNKTYLIEAKLLGYKAAEKIIDVKNDDINLRVNFFLQKTTVELNEVLINARRNGMYNISTVEVSQELIRQLPSISGEMDLYRALTLLPGVTSSNEMSNGLYVRGGSPDQTLTLIDGVSVYNPFHLGGFASTFNSDAIKDIKLLKGGFPAEYGGRLSSVLDIKLKDGNMEKFRGNLGVGLISSRLSVEGPLTDKASYLLSARKMYLNSVQGAVVQDKNIPYYSFYDINGKLTFRINERNQVALSGYYGNDKLFAPPESEDADYDISWGNTFINLSWLNVPEMSKSGSGGKYTRFSATYTGYEFNTLIIDKTPYAFRQDFFSKSKISDIMLKGEGQYFSTESHTPKLGLEVIIHNFDLLNNNFFVTELNKDERIQNTITGIEASAYIQDEWKISPVLVANTGLRLYGFPRARYFRAEPRLSLSYALNDRTFIKGAYANGNQFLHLIVRNDVVLPTDMWIPSTPKVSPSQADQGILGFEYNTDDNEYLFSLEAYYKKMKNLYEYSDTTVFTFEKNIEDQLISGEGKAYGVELFLNKRIGSFTGWLGYTLSWTNRQFEGLNQGKEFFPRYDRRHDVSFVLSYKINDVWSTGLTWTYSTGQAYTMPTGQYYFPGVYSKNEGSPQVFLDYTDINDYRLPPYHKLDLSTTYSFSWNKLPCQLTFSVYNAYNRKNAFARYVNYRINSETKEIRPFLKQFTLFSFLPTISFNMEF